MKKFLLALLIGGATLATTNSCTKEYYEVDPRRQTITIVYSRTASQWQTLSNNTKYIDLSVPELTDQYRRYGAVTIAMSFDKEKTYNGLAATIDGISYNYDYATKSVRIYAQDPLNDDTVTILPPAEVFIKVSLTESDWVE